jgi:hypothetical protein
MGHPALVAGGGVAFCRGFNRLFNDSVALQDSPRGFVCGEWQPVGKSGFDFAIAIPSGDIPLDGTASAI